MVLPGGGRPTDRIKSFGRDTEQPWRRLDSDAGPSKREREQYTESASVHTFIFGFFEDRVRFHATGVQIVTNDNNRAKSGVDIPLPFCTFLLKWRQSRALKRITLQVVASQAIQSIVGAPCQVQFLRKGE